MTTRILNFFHERGLYRLLSLIMQLAYLIKGKGLVRCKYHSEFKAYEFRMKKNVYLSSGPGWAYCTDYLKNLLFDNFCHMYVPKLGDTVIDLGAGLGEETLIFAQLVGNSGSVFSIEANPVVFEGLKYVSKENNSKVITALNVAIYDRDDDFVFIEDNDQNYLINTISKVENSKYFKVRATTLDSLVRENKIMAIDFLKSNIEGAEQFLILGMDYSSHIIKNLCISCHDFRQTESEFYKTKEKVVNFLESHDFEVTIRNSGNPLVDDYVYARNKAYI